MWTVIVIMLVVWGVLAVVGFAFPGLLWLAVIGLILMVGTTVFGIVRQGVTRARLERNQMPPPAPEPDHGEQ